MTAATVVAMFAPVLMDVDDGAVDSKQVGSYAEAVSVSKEEGSSVRSRSNENRDARRQAREQQRQQRHAQHAMESAQLAARKQGLDPAVQTTLRAWGRPLGWI